MAARNTFAVDEKLETPFNIKHLLRAGVYIKRHTGKMAAAFLMSVAAAVTALYVPKISQWVLDVAVPQKDYAMLWRLLGLFACILAAGTVCNVVRARLMAKTAQGIIFDIREDLFAHLQKLPFS